MPTANQLLEAFPRDLTLHQAREIAKAMKTTYGKKADELLNQIDRAIDGHGIEAIRGEELRGGWFQDIVALYVNTGDTYNATVVYDAIADRWHVTTMGDWVEKNQRRYKII